ncbi:methionyl-tRNA formyltransferase [candidate division CPR3 bacterium GWF2_35_18]|uniref:Methionyl-tRNA formyltransferase n=1 Tax=candidate division CPR3 bacterium GW2011_GWF2_35_18 TaxID=1618350 RepID=A0A0G0C068_UNCC3|nr:MAG: Methionyl-tRNA formyltransferase [candidate division CPR3 bacterium GW2011_GWF2_35_18]OGB62949.1 MAG: methionyl-tRNA formyltransferase [candidate division CPR3 bacterium GWF2_35_18]OGB65925.1 MAG: methionyl-tRNA formyltransferase [candidate division CPR3 bacterium RIFOXYA2_FULL_35_13]
MNKIKIIFAGSSIYSTYFLETLLKSNKVSIIAILTQSDKPKGRKKEKISTPVKKFALKEKLNVLTPNSLKNPKIIEKIKSLKSDLIFIASYAKIIPPEIIKLPKLGIVCFHPSLLPKYRGSTPIQSAILNNEAETGYTIFLVDEKVDHGQILFQQKVVVNDHDDNHSLTEKLFRLGSNHTPSFLSDYANRTIQPIPQNHSQATFTKILSRNDGYIDISKESPKNIYQKFKAYYPWPGIWTNWDGKRLKITTLRYEDNKIIVDKVQLEGKKEMNLEEFKNGYRNFDLF